MARFAPIRYVGSVYEEGQKVVWPNRNLVVRHTVTVIVAVGIAMLIFAGIDYGFQKLVVLALGGGQ